MTDIRDVLVVTVLHVLLVAASGKKKKNTKQEDALVQGANPPTLEKLLGQREEI